VTSDPLYAIVRFFHSGQIAPVGVNWGGYKNPEVDALIDEAKQTFDPTKQNELLAQAHSLIVDDAVLVGGARHQSARAVALRSEVQAGAHWFQESTTIGAVERAATLLIPPPRGGGGRPKAGRVGAASAK
jgi:peptide/nickel transport system substrate-binding protein